MKVEFRKSFVKDLKKIKNFKLQRKIKSIIEEVENADNLKQISNLKFLKGENNHYRIRIGDYRIGIIIENDVVRFVRFLHRQKIYKFFP